MTVIKSFQNEIKSFHYYPDGRSLFDIFVVCFILIYCGQVILGIFFLFSGSHSEQDDNIDDSEALEQSFTAQNSELENHTIFNDSIDLYEVLGVQRNSSSREIRQSYLDLSRQNYPKIQNAKSFNFKFITRSYRILFNEDKRKIYDMTNNINLADNYEGNNENIDYMDQLYGSVFMAASYGTP